MLGNRKVLGQPLVPVLLIKRQMTTGISEPTSGRVDPA